MKLSKEYFDYLFNSVIDSALCSHILSDLFEKKPSSLEEAYNVVVTHLREHEVDDIRFYFSTLYLILILEDIWYQHFTLQQWN